MDTRPPEKRRKIQREEDVEYEEQSRAYSTLEAAGTVRRSSRKRAAAEYVENEKDDRPPFTRELEERECEYGHSKTRARLFLTRPPARALLAQLLPAIDLEPVIAGLEHEIEFTPTDLLLLCYSNNCVPLFKEQLQGIDFRDSLQDLVDACNGGKLNSKAEAVAALAQSHGPRVKETTEEVDIAITTCAECSFWLHNKNRDNFFYRARISQDTAVLICARLLLLAVKDMATNSEGFFNTLLASELGWPMIPEVRAKWEQNFFLSGSEENDQQVDEVDEAEERLGNTTASSSSKVVGYSAVEEPIDSSMISHPTGINTQNDASYPLLQLAPGNNGEGSLSSLPQLDQDQAVEKTFEKMYREWMEENEKLDREREDTAREPNEASLYTNQQYHDTSPKRKIILPDTADSASLLPPFDQNQERLRLYFLTEQYIIDPDEVTWTFEYLPNIDFTPFSPEEHLAFLRAYKAQYKDLSQDGKKIVYFAWRGVSAVLPRRSLKDVLQHYYANHGKMRMSVKGEEQNSATPPASPVRSGSSVHSAALSSTGFTTDGTEKRSGFIPSIEDVADSPMQDTSCESQAEGNEGQPETAEREREEQNLAAIDLRELLRRVNAQFPEHETDGQGVHSRLIKELCTKSMGILYAEMEMRAFKKAFKEVCDEEVHEAHMARTKAEALTREANESLEVLQNDYDAVKQDLHSVKEELNSVGKSLISANQNLKRTQGELFSMQAAKDEAIQDKRAAWKAVEIWENDAKAKEQKIRALEESLKNAERKAEQEANQRRQDAMGFSKRLQDRNDINDILINMLRDRKVEFPQELCKHEKAKK